MRNLLLIAVVGLLWNSAPARACIVASDHTFAFTREPPPERGATVVKLRLLNIDGSRAEAVLVEPFDGAPGIRRVIVETDMNSSCSIGWGVSRGEVYAIVASSRVEGDILYVQASQQERKQSRAKLDRYRISDHLRSDAE